jgi:hypothetical protein
VQTVGFMPTQVKPAAGPVPVGLHPTPPVQHVSGPTQMASVSITVQTEAAVGEAVQVQPASVAQVAEHPSPPPVPPSSHVSVPTDFPSPHFGVHTVAPGAAVTQFQVARAPVQVGLHPCPS